MRENPRIRAFFEYVTVFLVIALFASIYYYRQPQIVAGKGFGWDGLSYAKMLGWFSGAQRGGVDFPFCNRIGTPFLAFATGLSDSLLAFRVVNVSFSVIFSLTVYSIAKRSGLDTLSSLISLFLTLGPFFSPIRFVYFYPALTDPAFLAFLAISFLCLINGRYGFSFVVLVIAYPFREVSIYILPVYLVFAVYLGGGRFVFFKFIGAMIVVVVLKYFISSYFGCNGSQLNVAIQFLGDRLSNPRLFLAYFAALSMIAAPVIYIGEIPALSEIEKISISGLCVAAALAFVGGSDCTRIFYSFFPMYFVAIVSVIRKRGYVFTLFCMIGYVVSNRFGERVQEPLNYWPSGDESGYFWQFPDHARPEVSLMVLAVWGLLFFLFEKMRKFTTAS